MFDGFFQYNGTSFVDVCCIRDIDGKEATRLFIFDITILNNGLIDHTVGYDDTIVLECFDDHMAKGDVFNRTNDVFIGKVDQITDRERSEEGDEETRYDVGEGFLSRKTNDQDGYAGTCQK